MLPRRYASPRCSVATTLEIVGDRRTMVVIRAAFSGYRASLGLHVVEARIGAGEPAPRTLVQR